MLRAALLFSVIGVAAAAPPPMEPEQVVAGDLERFARLEPDEMRAFAREAMDGIAFENMRIDHQIETSRTSLAESRCLRQTRFSMQSARAVADHAHARLYQSLTRHDTPGARGHVRILASARQQTDELAAKAQACIERPRDTLRIEFRDPFQTRSADDLQPPVPPTDLGAEPPRTSPFL